MSRLTAGRGHACLFDLDGRALILELLLDLGGLVLVDAFLDGLAAGLDQVLGLLQAETRDGADLLDDVDLLVTTGFEDDGELGLLLSRSGTAASSGTGSHGHGGRGRHAPLLLE